MAQSPGVPPIEDLRKKGYDDIFATGPHFGVTWEASQIKSVTENTGAFSAESDDVRYRAAEADYASVQDDAAMEYESALDTPMDISVADMMPIEAAENAQAAGLLRDVVKRFPDTKIAITDLSRVYAAAEVAEIDGDGVRYRVKSGIDTKSAPETELPEAETSFKGTAISSADGAKILNNWGNLTKDYENISSVKERTFSGSLTMPDTTTVSA